MSLQLFQEIKANYLFIKLALHGWKASGKSFTSVLIAYIICDIFGIDPNNIAYFDTEGRAIDIQESLGNPLGFKLKHISSRSFDTMLKAIDEAEKNGLVLIGDSMTHVYRSFCKGYLQSKGRKKMNPLTDSQPLQEAWQVFVDRYMNSKIHFIAAGRTANVFEDTPESADEDDDNEEHAKTKYKLRMTGTKMAIDKEFGYEPGLVFEMQKRFIGHTSAFYREVIISKDSTSLLEGRTFECKAYPDMPTRPTAAQMKSAALFYVEQTREIFAPYIERIAARRNQGGVHQAYNTVDTGNFWKNQKEAYKPDGKTLAEINLEKIEANFHRIFGSARGDVGKALKFFVLEKIFKTPAWTQVKVLPLVELEAGALITEKMLELFRANSANASAEPSEEFFGAMIDQAKELAYPTTKLKEGENVLDLWPELKDKPEDVDAAVVNAYGPADGPEPAPKKSTVSRKRRTNHAPPPNVEMDLTQTA